MSDSTPLTANVRSIISIFENQSVAVNGETTNLVRRTQSLSDLTFKPFVERNEINLEADQITQQIQHLQNNLSNYTAYSRENHIYYQNQIIFILIDVANISSLDSDHKLELTEQLKKLSKTLNSRLPTSRERTPSVTAEITSPTNTKFEPKRQKQEKKAVVSKQQEPKKVVEKEEPKVKKEEDPEPFLSVQSLKQLFEKNTNKNDDKRGSTKVARKFVTFNSTADFNYVKYSEKYKEDGSKKQVTFFDETPKAFGSTTPEVFKSTAPEIFKSTSPEINEDTTPKVNEDTAPEVNEHTTPERQTIEENDDSSSDLSSIDDGDDEF